MEEERGVSQEGDRSSSRLDGTDATEFPVHYLKNKEQYQGGRFGSRNDGQGRVTAPQQDGSNAEDHRDGPAEGPYPLSKSPSEASVMNLDGMNAGRGSDAFFLPDDADEADERRPSDRGSSASTWSNNSYYTEIQRTDLEKQAQGNWNYRHGHLYYLGSIWDVR